MTDGARSMELHAEIREEDGSFWDQITELPGCFASGDTVPELIEALQEAVSLYLATESGSPSSPQDAIKTSVASVGLLVPGRLPQPA